jgi:hypothetical protein
VHLWMLKRRDADDLDFCLPDRWESTLKQANDFKLFGFKPLTQAYEDEYLPTMKEAMPSFSSKECSMFLTALHSYFLTDFSFFTAAFQRKLETFRQITCVARKKTELNSIEEAAVTDFYNTFHQVAVRAIFLVWQNSLTRTEQRLLYRGCRFETMEAAHAYAYGLYDGEADYPISSSSSWNVALEFATPGCKMSIWETRLVDAKKLPDRCVGAFFIFCGFDGTDVETWAANKTEKESWLHIPRRAFSVKRCTTSVQVLEHLAIGFFSHHAVMLSTLADRMQGGEEGKFVVYVMSKFDILHDCDFGQVLPELPEDFGDDFDRLGMQVPIALKAITAMPQPESIVNQKGTAVAEL